MEKEVKLKPVEVVYTNSFGDPSQSDAFQRLEAIVPLKGNKFYATYNSETGEYCACAKITQKQANNIDLPIKVIDGGVVRCYRIGRPFQ